MPLFNASYFVFSDLILECLQSIVTFDSREMQSKLTFPPGILLTFFPRAEKAKVLLTSPFVPVHCFASFYDVVCAFVCICVCISVSIDVYLCVHVTLESGYSSPARPRPGAAQGEAHTSHIITPGSGSGSPAPEVVTKTVLVAVIDAINMKPSFGMHKIDAFCSIRPLNWGNYSVAVSTEVREGKVHPTTGSAFATFGETFSFPLEVHADPEEVSPYTRHDYPIFGLSAGKVWSGWAGRGVAWGWAELREVV